MSQLDVWETAVKERPYAARVAGPPNWLVLERANLGGAKPHEVAERMAAANAALRREYGLDVPRGTLGAPPDVPTRGESPQAIPTPCETCGVGPRDGRHKQCSACRKAKA